jgi:hypothetical protein
MKRPNRQPRHINSARYSSPLHIHDMLRSIFATQQNVTSTQQHCRCTMHEKLSSKQSILLTQTTL